MEAAKKARVEKRAEEVQQLVRAVLGPPKTDLEQMLDSDDEDLSLF
jgi:hypothetical protein